MNDMISLFSLFTFLPVVLYEQFKFFFNLYFLLVAISQFIPALKIGTLILFLSFSHIFILSLLFSFSHFLIYSFSHFYSLSLILSFFFHSLIFKFLYF
jgi:hypothetical protein